MPKSAIDRNGQAAARRLLLLVLLVGVPTWLALTITARRARTTQLSDLATGGSGSDHLRLWVVGQGLVGALVVLACALVLVWRVRSTSYERAMWGWWTAALAALAAGFLGDAVVTLSRPIETSSTIVWGGLPFGFCVLPACFAAYQGLMRWNRVRTNVSDTSDWLNGIGSVFAMVAIGNLIVSWTNSPLRDWPQWELQSWLLRMAVILVLAGSTATVAMLGDLIHDLRAWLICGVITAILGCEVAAVLHGSRAFSGWLPHLGWLIGGIAVAACAVRTPEDRKPAAATMQATTAGVLVVLAASAIVLVLDSTFTNHPSRLLTVYAVLGFLCASAQGVHIIRALSQLATTRLEARSDELTGIANRRALLARLGHLIAARAEVGLLVIDLDRFKAINDRFGHLTGDALLRHASDRLQNQTPTGALLARLGGDEFAVLLEGTTIDAAAELASLLVDTLSSPFDIGSQRMNVGASIGVAWLPGPAGGTPDDEGEDLLRRADVAMYRAKRAGGGVSIYDVGVDTAAQERDSLLEDLRAVLAVDASLELQSQLVVHYQPQLDVLTGHIAGVEALVRWQHPRLGLLPPAAFIELAEFNGLIRELTARVLQVATTQAVNWRIAGHPVRMAVNLSPSFLTSTELVPLIDRILAVTPLNPAELTLEITETGLMSDPELALKTTREIAARGIAVSIDDFGSGYSSLSYLNDLPATELKLDRSFTARLATDERTSAIVAGTIQLAHHLGLRVVAEGVEDQAELNVLRVLDCDEVQGYLCGRPMPADDLDAWLQKQGHTPADDRIYL